MPPTNRTTRGPRRPQVPGSFCCSGRPATTYGALVMSVSRRGVDVLMDCCRPPVVAGLPLQQKDPGTSGLRGPRVVRLVGGTQHHVLCAANRSLLDSCDSCGNARGRLARRPRFERFVTKRYFVQARIGVSELIADCRIRRTCLLARSTTTPPQPTLRVLRPFVRVLASSREQLLMYTT